MKIKKQQINLKKMVQETTKMREKIKFFNDDILCFIFFVFAAITSLYFIILIVSKYTPQSATIFAAFIAFSGVSLAQYMQNRNTNKTITEQRLNLDKKLEHDQSLQLKLIENEEKKALFIHLSKFIEVFHKMIITYQNTIRKELQSIYFQKLIEINKLNDIEKNQYENLKSKLDLSRDELEKISNHVFELWHTMYYLIFYKELANSDKFSTLENTKNTIYSHINELNELTQNFITLNQNNTQDILFKHLEMSIKKATNITEECLEYFEVTNKNNKANVKILIHELLHSVKK